MKVQAFENDYSIEDTLVRRNVLVARLNDKYFLVKRYFNFLGINWWAEDWPEPDKDNL